MHYRGKGELLLSRRGEREKGVFWSQFHLFKKGEKYKEGEKKHSGENLKFIGNGSPFGETNKEPAGKGKGRFIQTGYYTGEAKFL